MLMSAELRWLWDGECPADVRQWFEYAQPNPGGGAIREDIYARALDGGQEKKSDIGIKKRGGKSGVEIKGLVSTLPSLNIQPFVGDVQLWCKWTYRGSLDLPEVVTTHKRRWLRKFDTSGASVNEIALDPDEKRLDGRKELPDDGCNLELTRVTVAGSRQEWWTLGFEAFGKLRQAEENLKQTIEFVTLRRPLPSIKPDALASYPEWLSRVSGV